MMIIMRKMNLKKKKKIQEIICNICNNGRLGDWIQCNGNCEGWFHQKCVKFGNNVLIEHWKCDSCN